MFLSLKYAFESLDINQTFIRPLLSGSSIRIHAEIKDQDDDSVIFVGVLTFKGIGHDG